MTCSDNENENEDENETTSVEAAQQVPGADERRAPGERVSKSLKTRASQRDWKRASEHVNGS